MSYLVLARKWRPQAFDDVTGQEHVVRTLANAIALDRVAHAFLLCGPRGVGKTTTARLLARALNCVKGPTATPCGECSACTEITSGSSVDVVEIDGASNNGVDNVRELREVARYLPQRDRHKIFIIDEVHMLSVAAFNALLKTLEEPPPHVKFIFATTDPQKLPETILSRCQRHNFKRVPLASMVQRLKTICEAEGIHISDRSLRLVALQADGGMRDALSLLDQLRAAGDEVEDGQVEEALGLVDRTVVHAIVDGLLTRDGGAVLEKVAEVHERGVELRKLGEEIAQALRDLVYVKATGKAPPDMSDAEEKALVEQAGRADSTQLTRLFDLVQTATKDLAQAPQPRLALEVALLTGVHLAPSQSLADLAARLENLAGGAPASAPAPKAAAPALAPAPARSSPPPARAGADLASQVEQMARGRASPRQTASRPASRPPEPSGDDEPHRPLVSAPPSPPRPAEVERSRAVREAIAVRAADEDEPPPPGDEDSPERTFEVDTSPGGCATAECLADDPLLPEGERFRMAVDTVKKRAPMVGLVLAEARLLSLAPGHVTVGFTPEQKFHRAQLAGMRTQLEDLLTAHFGQAVRLTIEEAAEGSPASPADEARRAWDERVRQLRGQAKESSAVVAVLATLGGEIDEIEVLEERR